MTYPERCFHCGHKFWPAAPHLAGSLMCPRCLAERGIDPKELVMPEKHNEEMKPCDCLYCLQTDNPLGPEPQDEEVKP